MRGIFLSVGLFATFVVQSTAFVPTRSSRLVCGATLRGLGLPSQSCARREARSVAFVTSLGSSSSSSSGVSSSQQTSTQQQVLSLAKLYRRVSWLSWWFQIILSVVGGVILTFANTVRGRSGTYALWSSGFAFSAFGAASALLSAIWTWNMTRMSRRIALKKIEESRVLPTLRRLSQISVTLSLVGMLVTLFAAEQIVGTLASKVLSSQGLVPTLAIGTQLNQIQALDIFLVQANTNILVSHYVPLVAQLWLQNQLPSAKSQAQQ